jgi:hypothetical protein
LIARAAAIILIQAEFYLGASIKWPVMTPD